MCFRLAMKYVDESLAVLDKNSTINDDKSADMSVLQKLLRVNRNYAILMTIDTLVAGIDTVWY